MVDCKHRKGCPVSSDSIGRCRNEIFCELEDGHEGDCEFKTSCLSATRVYKPMTNQVLDSRKEN